MDWEVELIALYLFVCKHYQRELFSYCVRMARHADLRFSDEEAITIYLHGVIEGYRTIGAIHRYAQRHLRAWFPHLPGYKAFDYRINAQKTPKRFVWCCRCINGGCQFNFK